MEMIITLLTKRAGSVSQTLD